MSRVGAVVSIASHDDSCFICSNVSLILINDSDINNDLNVVFVLGLPVELSNEEFEQFVDPFMSTITGYSTLVEAINPPVHSLCNLTVDLLQFKKSIILTFDSEASKVAFISLYNNIQVPSYSEVAPCLVVGLDHVEVRLTGRNNSFDSKGDLNDTDLAEEITGREEGSILHGLVQHNSVTTDTSLLVTISEQRCDSSGTLHAAGLSCQMLPTCVVCLRRLVSVGFGIPGAGDLKICRSYIYDNNVAMVSTDAAGQLQFTARRAAPTMSPTAAASRAKSRSPHSRQASGAPTPTIAVTDEEQHLTPPSECLRCVICHVYGAISEHKYSSSHGRNAYTDALLFEPIVTAVAAPASSSSSSPSKPKPLVPGSFCLDCGLTDNIWLCMLCSFAGCGRYKGQHAQQHFDRSGHALSLELASGRVWDYHSDTFVHIDDTALASGSLHAQQPQQFQQYGYGADGGGSADGEGSNGEQQHQQQQQGYFSKDRDGQEFDARPLLDSATVDKMDGLVRRYEDLLRAQLADQQLHYEKLIARETLRALELTYNAQTSGKGDGGGTKRGTKEPQSKADSAQLKSSAVGVVDTTTSSSSSEVEEVGDEDEVQAQIEEAKLEISSIEAQCRAVLDRVKAVEDDTRAARKQNDALIKRQKALRERESELLLQEEAVRQRCAAQVAEMEQQIRDLTFYTRTRKEMQASPMKDELMEGTVVGVQSNNSTGGGDSGRKEGKGNRKVRK